MMAPLPACNASIRRAPLKWPSQGRLPRITAAPPMRSPIDCPKHTDVENELIVLGLEFPPQLRSLLDPEDPSAAYGNRCPKGLASGSGADDFRFLHLGQKCTESLAYQLPIPRSRTPPQQVRLLGSESTRANRAGGERSLVVNARRNAPGGIRNRVRGSKSTNPLPG